MLFSQQPLFINFLEYYRWIGGMTIDKIKNPKKFSGGGDDYVIFGK